MKNRGHGFEREQARVYGSVWRKEREGENGTRKSKCPCGRRHCLPSWQMSLLRPCSAHLQDPPASPPPQVSQLGSSLIATATSQHRVLAQLLASHKVELPPVSEPLARLHGPSQIPKFLACPNPSEETKMPCFFPA